MEINHDTNIEVSEDDKTYSWKEIENSDVFKKLIEKSDKEIENGECQELTDDLLDEIFKKHR